jgi:C-terminal processing protease CtpA/Prc
MLRDADQDVQKYYYDPKLHDVDWSAKVRQARDNISKAESVDNAVSEVAALLDSLNDSHTYLTLPVRTHTHDYGFKLQMIGDHCYVVNVRAGSDAEKKGLKRGDEIVAINDHPVTRKTLWRLHYIYDRLRPQAGLRLALSGEGSERRQLDVTAKIDLSKVNKYSLHQGMNQIARDEDDWRQSVKPQYFERGDDLLVVKLPEFFRSALQVDDMLGRMRKHKGVVLDLRHNPGGADETMRRVIGGMFETDRRVYDRVARSSTEEVSVSGRHHDAYTGRLAVLVDSASASAAEIFARVMELEKRGFVLGDRTSGMVMQTQFHPHDAFVDWMGGYGVSVTDADLRMTDGATLEHVGVEPDIVVLPTPQDLAARRDPALSKAAGLVGAKLTPEEAGAAFPDTDFATTSPNQTDFVED